MHEYPKLPLEETPFFAKIMAMKEDSMQELGHDYSFYEQAGTLDAKDRGGFMFMKSAFKDEWTDALNRKKFHGLFVKFVTEFLKRGTSFEWGGKEYILLARDGDYMYFVTPDTLSGIGDGGVSKVLTVKVY